MVRKVNFLGFEVNVVEESDIDEQARSGVKSPYIIVRCAEINDAGASPDLLRRRRRTLCEGCGEVCWYDPKSLEQFARLQLEFICIQCMADRDKGTTPRRPGEPDGGTGAAQDQRS